MNSFMEKLEGILNKYLMPVADNLNKNKIMTAIKESLRRNLCKLYNTTAFYDKIKIS